MPKLGLGVGLVGAIEVIKGEVSWEGGSLLDH